MDKKKIVHDIYSNLSNLKEEMSNTMQVITLLSECIEHKKFLPQEIITRGISCLSRIQQMDIECRELYNLLEDCDFEFEHIEEFESELHKKEQEIEENSKIEMAELFYQLKAEEDLIEELEEYKKKLGNLIEQIKKKEKEFAETKPYIDLLYAIMNVTKEQSDVLVKYITSLSGFFGYSFIGKALIDKKITYSGPVLEILKKEGNEPAEKNETVSVQEENKTCTYQSEKEAEQTELPEEITPVEECQEEVKYALLPESISLGELEIEKSSREEKKFGVSAFLNDIRHGTYPKTLVAIIKLVEKSSVANLEYILQSQKLPKNATKSSVESSLRYLVSRGYLRKYVLSAYGHFYCITNKCEKAFLKRESCTFLGTTIREAQSDGKTIEHTVIAALTRIAYAKMLEVITKYRKKEPLSVENMFETESFWTKVVDSGKNIDMFLGCFWSTAEECQSYYEKVKEDLHVNENVGRIFYVGVNLDCILELVKSFEDFGIEILAKDQYAYSMEESVFYTLHDSKVVEPEEIWKLQEETSLGEEEVKEEVSLEEEEAKEEEVSLEEKGTEEEEISFEENMSESNEAGVEHEDTGKKGALEQKLSLLPDEKIKEIRNEVYQMIVSDKLFCATTFLRGYGEKYSQVKGICNKLAYAVNDPVERCSYSTDKIFDIFLDDNGYFHDYLMIATVLRTFFSNHIQYDYSMKTFYEGNVKSLPIVSENACLSNLIYVLLSYKDSNHKGVDTWSDYHMKEKVLLEEKLDRIKREACDFYHTTILGYASESKSNTRFINTKNEIFSKKGDIAEHLWIVMEDQKDMLEMMREFLTEHFIKEEGIIDIVNIDNMKIERYLEGYWNKAGNNMRTVKKTSDLMGSLRQNLFNSIYKAVSIMCNWVMYSEKMENEATDSSFEEYKKIRNKLLDDLCNVKKILSEKQGEDISLEELAGIRVLTYTLCELEGKIQGTYNEQQQEFFYIDFLKQNEVFLDDNFMPVMDDRFGDIKELSLAERIRRHCQNQSKSWKERLDFIFKDHGDDYGTARLILEYLQKTNQMDGISNYNLKESISFAKRDAKNKKNQFVENLELMQSYGQIDNSKENKKEKILQIINDAYEFSCNTCNFGFLYHLMEAYIKQIKDDAKVREESIVRELEAYRLELKESSEEVEKTEKLKKVQEMLEKQNYTVAEDLLSRIKSNEPDVRVEYFEEDDLAKFLKNYDIYYNRVKDSSYSFSYLVNSRIRNKDDKGGKRLADNWMINGQKLNPTQLKTLLQTLGFSVGMVKEQKKISKYDNYIVTLAKPVDGRKINYKHPIAAFGSQATEEGFRVVFLYGKYDAKRIIAAINEIGNAKNTIILLDYALLLTERRILARKLKEEMFGKSFGIIDRVLFMYLISNYNEERVNQMLMSVMMPFSYYQPYVWDSTVVMPPEIFMGRNEELEKIESPKGVNIVYGGRQLGKSALLKMAKNDIDKNENHDRAVLVDIKGLDYKKAAKKIGEALYDEGVLETDISTEDWGELARVIKQRLAQEKDKIPYLLLLLDEADVFIDSCEENNYQAFDALKDIQGVGVDRFKFVIAGLRNIVRFKRNLALGNNSVITHLESMTVKPFKENEARELLEIPLYYLGLRFPKEKESLITLIFANANYFPGLIQLYCAKLVEAMRKGDYAGYSELDAPIYEVQESHIKKVLSEEGFMQQIREKFEITLKLDEDNYYYIIALLMAILYHEKGYNNGFTPKEVYDEGCCYYIAKIKNLKLDKLVAFMEELEELNVLRKTSNNAYLFNRYSFFLMMGAKSEVEEKLMEYMED